MRTSEEFPLRIATLTLEGATGRIGVTFCPGKKQKLAMSGAWDRDMDMDLRAIAEWGASHLLTLIQARELEELEVTELGLKAAEHGLAWHHAPIPDMRAPGPGFEASWDALGARLRRALTDGESVVVHCKGGLGRAGTIAARLLMELAEPRDAAGAIARVRGVRPGAVETREQERYLELLEATLSGG